MVITTSLRTVQKQGEVLLLIFKLLSVSAPACPASAETAAPDQPALLLSPAEVQVGDIMLRFSASFKQRSSGPSVTLAVEAENRGGATVTVRSGSAVLNGRFMTDESFLVYALEPGRTGSGTLSLWPDDLMGLDFLSEIAFTVKVEAGATDPAPQTADVRLELSGDPVAGAETPEPLAESESDSVAWMDFSLEYRDYGGLRGVVYIRNDTDEPLYRECSLLVDGVMLEGVCILDADPHTEAFRPFEVWNYAVLFNDELTVEGSGASKVHTMDSLLQHAGLQSASRLEFWPRFEAAESPVVSLPLSEPFALSAATPAPATAVLLEGNVEVRLESAVVADNGVSLGLWIVNHTDEGQSLSIQLQAADDVPAAAEPLVLFRDAFPIPPRSAAAKCVALKTEGLLPFSSDLGSLDFRFFVGKQPCTPSSLEFPDGTSLGTYLGMQFFAEDLTVTAGEPEE